MMMMMTMAAAARGPYDADDERVHADGDDADYDDDA
jgi:hypothetical protein